MENSDALRSLELGLAGLKKPRQYLSSVICDRPIVGFSFNVKTSPHPLEPSTQ
jgi:hypothetical protein